MTDSNTESTSTESTSTESTSTESTSTENSSQRADEFTEPSAGPTPTPDEERAAERSAGDVDLDQVAEHYEEMNEKGANIEGEGQVS